MKNKNRTAGMAVKMILLIAVIGLFIAAGNSAAEEMKIVSIKANQVLQSHPSFQEAVSKYREKAEKAQEELAEMDEEQQVAAQQEMQQELQQLGMTLEKEARDQMEKDIRKVAKAQGYDYVIDSNGIVAGNTEKVEDVTVQVIESFSRGK